MQKIDDNTYKKYFTMRRKKASGRKNKKLAADLEKKGPMTDFGRNKIKEAKQNGQWNAPKTDAGREKRIAWMVDRLNKNLKPM